MDCTNSKEKKLINLSIEKTLKWEKILTVVFYISIKKSQFTLNYHYLNLNTKTECLTDSLETCRRDHYIKTILIWKNLQKDLSKTITTFIAFIKNLTQMSTATRLTDWWLQESEKKKTEKRKRSKAVVIT